MGINMWITLNDCVSVNEKNIQKIRFLYEMKMIIINFSDDILILNYSDKSKFDIDFFKLSLTGKLLI